MGLIRKTLAVSTAGIVRPNSKKQRVAKAQLKELRTQTELLQRTAPDPDLQARGDAALARVRELNAAAKARAEAERRARDGV